MKFRASALQTGILGLTALAGITGSVLLYRTTRAREVQVARASQLRNANQNLVAVSHAFREHARVVESVKTFYKASELVTRQEFEAFTTPLLASHPSIRALEWAIKVERPQRDAYEQESAGPQHITEWSDEGALRPAGDRNWHVVVHYVEPYEGNESAMGYDLASEPAVLNALRRAELSGEVSATTPIRLVQDDDAPVGILICMPIFDAEPDRGDPTTARRTLGFVVGILRIDDVVKEALAACHTKGLCIRIVDTQAPPGQDVLYQTCKSEMGKPHGQSGEPGRTCYGHFLADLHFRIAGRDWALSVGLDPPGLAPVVSPAPLLLLLAGLLVTALLAAYLLRLLQFNHRLGVEVRERERAERELLRSQEELEHRVARRTRELTNKADALQRMSVELSLTEERERRKLAIALHDQIGQTLSLIQMKLLDLRNETSLETLSREIGQCLDLTQETKQRVHSMEADLCPSILYDYGFEEAARWLADRTMQEHGFDVNFTDDGLDKPMSEATQLVLYRSLRELLFNVVKYAKATMVDVSISQRDGNAVLSVRDDGVGFSADPEGTPGSQGGCFGLASIRQQVGRVNGRVEINSAVGRGTSVEITVPLELGGKDLSPEGLGQPQEPAHG